MSAASKLFMVDKSVEDCKTLQASGKRKNRMDSQLTGKSAGQQEGQLAGRSWPKISGTNVG